ncbi:hypothetical protein TGAM01_v208009 [Trichoderma gamsii]|uniref:Uncharacterized protein n=1 Tax=Trichoderma gamsii TaxID=398673 RepID=A0A2P4ZFD5_9HYPO|nr:hypothetical protein TGAM01_v208009 [Trichoderma gamsii]PON23004.1 hypothetical protein TGAM01_v208009 [Trichoderma gamsii]
MSLRLLRPLPMPPKPPFFPSGWRNPRLPPGLAAEQQWCSRTPPAPHPSSAAAAPAPAEPSPGTPAGVPRPATGTPPAGRQTWATAVDTALINLTFQLVQIWGSIAFVTTVSMRPEPPRRGRRRRPPQPPRRPLLSRELEATMILSITSRFVASISAATVAAVVVTPALNSSVGVPGPAGRAPPATKQSGAASIEVACSVSRKRRLSTKPESKENNLNTGGIISAKGPGKGG